MKLLLVVLSTSLMLLVSSCSSSLNQDQYVRWVESYDHGLHTKVKVNDYTLDVQYKPTDYVALQRITYDGNERHFDQARRGMDNLQYYTLTISTNDLESDLLQSGSLSEKQRLLYYFSYELQHDIYLEEDGKKRPCQLYHFERSYNLKPTQTFVLGFDRERVEAPKSTLVISPPLFSPEPVRITLRKQNIPSLTL